MIQHGVTTVLTGNCSLSLAPVRAEHRPDLGAIFGYIEDMPKSMFSEGIQWNWVGYPEYHEILARQSLATNVATLVGHTALSLFVIGDESWERSATETERKQMTALLDEALCAGACAQSFIEQRRHLLAFGFRR